MKLYKMQVGGFETKEIKNEYTTTYSQVGDDREADHGTQKRILGRGVLIITLLLIKLEHNMVVTISMWYIVAVFIFAKLYCSIWLKVISDVYGTLSSKWTAPLTEFTCGPQNLYK